MTHLIKRVALLAQELAIDPENIGTMSIDEGVAAALLHGRLDLLSARFDHPLDAIAQLDEPWLEAVLEAHRIGWR
ncbi:hypothetical protein ACVBEF_01280 [Glaciimonas sp. GG7]